MHAALSGLHQSVSAAAMSPRCAWLLISSTKVCPFCIADHVIKVEDATDASWQGTGAPL